MVIAKRCSMPNTVCMPNDKLLSTAKAAAALNVDRSTLTRMVQSGKVKPAVRGDGLRGALFFYPSEIRRALARMRAEQSGANGEDVA